MDMSQLTRLDEMPEYLSGNAEKNNPVDVVPIIQNVLEDTVLQLKKNGIDPVLELPERIIVNSPFAEPEGLIYSLFRNLVDNALAYATGTTRLMIVCKEAEKEGRLYYEFNVSDNGQGVEPQHLEHIFERFYRVDKGRSRKLGGTGLGLAIVKNAVAAHGGTTMAMNTPGGGLTIRFTLARY